METRPVAARSPRKEYTKREEKREQKKKMGRTATSVEGIRSQCKSSLHAPVDATKSHFMRRYCLVYRVTIPRIVAKWRYIRVQDRRTVDPSRNQPSFASFFIGLSLSIFSSSIRLIPLRLFVFRDAVITYFIVVRFSWISSC